MKFERIVTFEVSTGSTNAYRSVLSATGSFEIVGASRWDDMGAHLAYVVSRFTSPGSLVTIFCVPHTTTTAPWAASFTSAMTGVFTSPDGEAAWTFSVIFRIVGAAAIAPTAAAPTAVFRRKLRLDIFDFFSSAIRFPSVRVRERTSRTISRRPDRLEGYFDVCNTACYKSPVVNRPVPSLVLRRSKKPTNRRDGSHPLATLAAELRVFRFEVSTVAALHTHERASDSGGSEARLSDAFPERRRRGLNRGSCFLRNVARHGSHQTEAQGKSADAKEYDPEGADEE